MIGSKILGGPSPKIDQFASPRQTAHTIDRRPAGGVVDNSYFSQGFPSEAEDLYKEGHRILNEAMAAGRDQKKLKAAIDKLDTAVNEYFLLEKKHPDDPRIKKRIVLINRLRRLAMKSRTF
ncbi:MAG: hypothetical protein HQ592_01175 [Planctomycetes bacterium]|nr:hypothetical protein [Planctomycetota bacterium]